MRFLYGCWVLLGVLSIVLVAFIPWLGFVLGGLVLSVPWLPIRGAVNRFVYGRDVQS